MDYINQIRAAARWRTYATASNLEDLEIEGDVIREGPLHIAARHIHVFESGKFHGAGRLKLLVDPGSRKRCLETRVWAEFSGRLTEEGAEIHSVALEEDE